MRISINSNNDVHYVNNDSSPLLFDKKICEYYS